MVAQTLLKLFGSVALASSVVIAGCSTNSFSGVSSDGKETSAPTVSEAPSTSAPAQEALMPAEEVESSLPLSDSSIEPESSKSQPDDSSAADPSQASKQSADTASDQVSNAAPDTQSSYFIAEDHLDSFLYQYYDLINQGNYQQAWAKLGSDMQASSSYDSYVDWWSSINRVDVQSINYVYAGESGGQVMVFVSYDKRNGPLTREVLVMDIGPFSPGTSQENISGASTNDWLVQAVDVATSIFPNQTQDATPITPTSSLVINGIGPIRVGMTLQEAANATGLPIATPTLYDREDCEYYQGIGAPDGIDFMVSNGRIVRVDIDTEAITTLSGAGIGSSADDIKALYPGKIEVSGHKYVGNGQYLRFVPTDVADQDYRLLFETDENGKVTRFRAGFTKEVGYVEGCS
ncbi:MAG: hypothetical protein AAGD25_39495 [Cyanobacteria bacterium P01_F01_bin.150]